MDVLPKKWVPKVYLQYKVCEPNTLHTSTHTVLLSLEALCTIHILTTAIRLVQEIECFRVWTKLKNLLRIECTLHALHCIAFKFIQLVEIRAIRLKVYVARYSNQTFSLLNIKQIENWIRNPGKHGSTFTNINYTLIIVPVFADTQYLSYTLLLPHHRTFVEHLNKQGKNI